MFCKEIINVSDTLWEVQRKIKITHNPNVETWREHLRSDRVFKKEPYYYFCLEIVEAEIIDDESVIEIPLNVESLGSVE
jgi:hypothetical protein